MQMIDAALGYARRGLKVLPLHHLISGSCTCGDFACNSAGKHPRTVHGIDDATTDESQIRAWWEKVPDANIGIKAGEKAWFLDIDPRHGGNDSFERMIREHGPLPETVTVETGGSGRHLWFAVNGTPIRGRIGMLPGIDVKSTGGYGSLIRSATAVETSSRDSARTLRL